MSFFRGKPRLNTSSVSLQNIVMLCSSAIEPDWLRGARRSILWPLLLLSDRLALPGLHSVYAFPESIGKERRDTYAGVRFFRFHCLCPKSPNHVLYSPSSPLPHSPQLFHEDSFFHFPFYIRMLRRAGLHR